jgi:hypothetical protein
MNAIRVEKVDPVRSVILISLVLLGLNGVLVTTGANGLGFSGTNHLGTELYITYEASSPGMIGVRPAPYV